MTCPGCQKERPFLYTSPLGSRCGACIGIGVHPSLRTEARMIAAMMLAFFMLFLFPPLLLPWLLFAAASVFFWTSANRWPALGGLALLACTWLLLVPAVIAAQKTFPFVYGSPAGGAAMMLASVLLFIWLWRPVRYAALELVFRGRGFAAGVLRAGAITAILATFVLGLLILI